MEWDGLLDRWRRRQEGLAALLEEFQVTDYEFRVDLEKGMFYWVEPDATPRLVADCRVLCSYALSNHSVLASWANPHLSDSAVVDPILDLPESLQECNEEDAWAFAIKIADASGADFLYRAPDPQVMVFLGLWNVRPPAPGEEFKATTPAEFVVGLLELLTQAAEDPDRSRPELGRLFVNYGKTLRHHARYVHRGTPEEDRLMRCGARLIDIGEQMAPGSLDSALQELRSLQAEWEGDL